MAKKDELPQEMTDRMARERNIEEREMVAGPIRSFGKKMYETVMGTEAQNAKAKAEMKEAAKKYPEGLEAKYEKAVGKAKGGMIKSSASKRADGIAMRGKTRGKIC